ncbi:MAG: MG2 domain-containing protein, partial [Raineya sp.]|nr:MG2 domain-containing protein [Raineya sp.]
IVSSNLEKLITIKAQRQRNYYWEIEEEYEDGEEEYRKRETEKTQKFEQITITAHPQGLKITGNFEAGKNYELHISSALEGIAGGKMFQEYLQTISFGKIQPQITFTEKKAMYLTSKGQRNIGVKIVNIPEIEVAIYKIYENNLLNFLENYDYQLERETTYEYGNASPYERYGSLISKQTFEVERLPAMQNGIHLLNIGADKFKDFKGVYAVVVGSKQNLYEKAFKLVAVSDIGLIAKENDDEVWVFANSILDAKPLKNVKINLISSNNQILAQTNTDENGIAKISDLKEKYPDFRLGMITATAGEDFTFLNFEKSRVETSRYDVGGLRSNQEPYQAFVALERDLYRPGEKANFLVLVRNEEWKIEKMPLKVRFTMPNGKELVTLKGNLNEQGAWEGSLRFPEDALTGSYKMEVLTFNDILLNTQNISVEEFMPDRIKIVQKTDKKSYQAGETIILRGKASNLYGTPASNRSYQIDFLLKRKIFAPKGYEKFDFNVVGKEISFSPQMKEGITTQEGELKAEFKIDEVLINQGLWEGYLYTTVFDETGRPVRRGEIIEVPTQNVFIGIERGSEYLDAGQELPINLVALDKEGKPLQTSAVVQVVRFDWQNTLERDSYSENVRYVSNKKEKVISEQKIRINGKAILPIRVAGSGEYEVRVREESSSAYVAYHFFAYAWGMTDYSSFEINKDGQIDITSDKETYNIGETAKLLFKTPFEGKLLVTIERNKVLQHFYLETEKKAASFNLRIADDYLPNIYVSATLIKPHTNSAIPLTVAHGYLPLKVEPSRHKIDVTIQAQESSFSNTSQTIKVKTSESNAEVVLAVVDEGILQIKDFQSPNPLAYFFQKRALEVDAYDLYPRLFPELKPNKSSVGGGGEALAEQRNKNNTNNNLSNKRVKLTTFWSGILKTNSSGEASYTIDIPQFSGSLRIMAIAYKGSRFGGNTKFMKVADPVVISSGIPRFLAPNDEVIIPATFANTTTETLQGTAQISVGEGLQVVGNTQIPLGISANEEKQAFFKVKATDFVGKTKIIISFATQNRKFEEKTDIAVRSAVPMQKKVGFGALQAGNQNINLQHSFIPSTTKATLVISKSPMAEFSDNLDYLLQYPYGCVEQTISTAFPQLYLTELSRKLKKSGKYEGSTAQESRYFVQEAIMRLQAMQMYNGALSYWAGGDYESWWGSVYAAHFLYEAQKAGYNVNEAFLERLTKYLQTKVREKHTETYSYFDEQNRLRSRTIIAKEIPYTLYVLALMRRGDIAIMNYCKANSAMLALDSKYLLAVSYLLMGDKASYNAVLPKSFSGERSKTALGGSFYSPVRDEAIALNALLEVEPQNPQVPMMSKRISEILRSQKWLNTQESAFALLALGKLTKQAEKTDLKASFKLEGKEIAQFVGEDVVVELSNLSNKSIGVNVSGKGNLYYFWKLQGLERNPQIKERDNFLKVRRTFYNRAGQEIKSGIFEQNDLIVVKVSIQTEKGENVPNVAITDLLPAGFEIENPRLMDAVQLPWIQKAAKADYVDIRDDRIHIFCEATGETKDFYYMVRAVSLGEFQMGAIAAEAMYADEYYSYSGARKVKIESRKFKIAENVEAVEARK